MCGDVFLWTPGRFVGGALCLDLVNTVVHPLAPSRHDRLVDARALAGWVGAAIACGAAGHAARTPVETPPALTVTASRDDLGGARALRQSIDALFRPATHGNLPDLSRAAPLLAEAARHVAGLRCAGGHVQVGAGRCVPDVLGLCALSAVRLIATLPNDRLRACAACDRLFLDRSRNGRRRWCDMAVCGNRAKARRLRDRARGESGESGGCGGMS